MSGHNRVMVIGGTKKLLKEAKKLGLEVIYIQLKDQIHESQLAFSDHTFLIDFRDQNILLPLAKAVYDAMPFKYVISMTESGLIPTAQVNDLLNLRGNSLKTVELLKDKWAMRQFLNARGISPVRAGYGKSKEDIVSFVENSGFPVIVKPVSGAGSFGIFVLKNFLDIDTLFQEVKQLNISDFIIEEYLEGTEISVESFSFNGKHKIISITDKLTLPNFVEIGHTIPAQMEEELYKEISEVLISFLDAVGFKEGPAHTEFKLSSGGPKIIESHNRVGGDKINDLVRIAYDVDMVALAMAWPFGFTSEEEFVLPANAKGVAIRFFNPQPGVVQEILGLETIKNHQGVVETELKIKVGDSVKQIKHSPDRVGYMIAKGKNAWEAAELCEKCLQEVRIVTA